MNDTSLMQVMVLSPESVWPGLQFTSTTVPIITGKVLVVIMSDTAAGNSVHVSVRKIISCNLLHDGLQTNIVIERLKVYTYYFVLVHYCT